MVKDEVIRKILEKGLKIEVEVLEDSSKKVKRENDSEEETSRDRKKQKGKETVNEEDKEIFTLPPGIYAKTPATLSTLVNIVNSRRRRAPRPGSRRFLHDNTSTGYGWLLPGWVAEERIMEHGRIYRYYYDPNGRLYHGQEEVLGAWADSGLIVLDL